MNENRDTVADKLAENAAVVACRKQSARVHNANVKKRITELTSDMGKRHSSYTARATVQHKKLNLPPYLTTTIASFSQTTDIRKARSDFRNGELSEAAYHQAMQNVNPALC